MIDTEDGRTYQLTYSNPADPFFKKLIIRSIEALTGRARLEQMLNEVLSLQSKSSNIWELFKEKLEVILDYDVNQIKKIPSSGPVIFISNHPFGVVDGVIVGHLTSLVRSNFKILVNEVLCKEELLNQYFLPIDFADTKEATKTNIETKRLALDHLNGSNAIVIFPAGGVSTAPKFWKKAEDLEWKRFVAKLIKQSEATVIPIFFHGQNSRLFQIVSQFSLDLRLSLLLNEVRNKIGKTIKIEIGDPIPYSSIAFHKDNQRLIDFLREIVYRLKDPR